MDVNKVRRSKLTKKISQKRVKLRPAHSPQKRKKNQLAASPQHRKKTSSPSPKRVTSKLLSKQSKNTTLSKQSTKTTLSKQSTKASLVKQSNKGTPLKTIFVPTKIQDDERSFRIRRLVHFSTDVLTFTIFTVIPGFFEACRESFARSSTVWCVVSITILACIYLVLTLLFTQEDTLRTKWWPLIIVHLCPPFVGLAQAFITSYRPTGGRIAMIHANIHASISVILAFIACVSMVAGVYMPDYKVDVSKVTRVWATGSLTFYLVLKCITCAFFPKSVVMNSIELALGLPLFIFSFYHTMQLVLQSTSSHFLSTQVLLGHLLLVISFVMLSFECERFVSLIYGNPDMNKQ